MASKNRRYLLVGDVHGCLYTLKKMLNEHWQPQDTRLILLGDMVFKGKHSLAVLNYLYEMALDSSLDIIFLKGNNEDMLLKHRNNIPAMQERQGVKLLDTDAQLRWIEDWKHFYEEKHFFASHAGVGVGVNIPINHKNFSLIYQRNVLKNINKTQFIGHIVVEKPLYVEESDAWYIDTGAGNGDKLTAVLLDENQSIKEFYTIDVVEEDMLEIWDTM
ncbi:MAG: hypothetical protein Q4F57_05275 [Weeksellaceae bacterium]|nr:hypothetical protein [Weeksellaceae bacterium]